MKKHNLYTLIVLCLMMVAVFIYASYQDTSPLFVLKNTQVKEDEPIDEIVKVDDDLLEDEDDNKQEEIKIDNVIKKDDSTQVEPPKEDKKEDHPLDEVNQETPPKEDKKEENKKDEPNQVEPPKEDNKPEEIPSEPIISGDVANAVPINVDDTLFIGDSRTVGIKSYAGLNEADFFCSVGMSVFNIYDQSCNIKDLGKVGIDTLLASKQYNKIHVMLGINEIGYNLNRVRDEFSGLINKIVDKQPNAKVFVGANLHVTKQYSDNQKYINNERINKLNDKFKKLCNGSNIIYIDTNVYFDDQNHALASDKTSDNVHLYAKYYCEWSDWIRKEMQVKLGG